MTLEKLAKQIFDECAKEGEPITMEEAQEMAQMEINAKGIKVGARATEPKAEKERVRKENPTKEMVIHEIAALLPKFAEDIEILNVGKLISFRIGEEKYEIDLKQKRKPKK